jgi:hypothetical protein
VVAAYSRQEGAVIKMKKHPAAWRVVSEKPNSSPGSWLTLAVERLSPFSFAPPPFDGFAFSGCFSIFLIIQEFLFLHNTLGGISPGAFVKPFYNSSTSPNQGVVQFCGQRPAG